MLKPFIGADVYKTIAIGRYLRDEPLTATYKFTTPSELEKALEESASKGNKIYWTEMFYRCHMASYSGLKRILDWISILEKSNDNFISYCSALRGLMECAGDTYDGLNIAAATLGDNKSIINEALDGKLETLLLSQELEEALIHFTHASKQYAKVTGLSYHKPKKPFEYVKILEKGSSIQFYKYYEFLCELTHPAGTSLGYNFIETPNGEVSFSTNRDQALIQDSLTRDKELITELLMRGFNPIFVLIKTINLFKLEELHSKLIDTIDLQHIPVWKRILNGK